MSRHALSLSSICIVLLTFLGGVAQAEDKPAKADRAISLADGKITLTAPEGWMAKKPTTNIVAYEFAAPAVEGDKADARLTIGATGGSVEANIDRWVAQVTQPDGKPSGERAVKRKLDVAGHAAHLVDISGTYVDRPRGPLGPTVNREEYRLLAAMIVVGDQGQYFVKFDGPRKTIAANEKEFEALVKSLKVAK